MTGFLLEQGASLSSEALWQLSKARERPGVRQVHALRVAIKRMRALVTTVHELRPAARRPRKALRRWKRLFRVLGELREQQVCAQLARRMRGIPAEQRNAYLAHANAQAERLTAAALDLMHQLTERDGQRIARYVEKAVENVPDRVLMNEMNSVLRTGWQEARKTMRAPSCDLHALRKQVKNVWYMLRLLEKTGRPLPKDIPLDELGRMQRLLGDWHDARVLADDIRAWHGGGAAQRTLLNAAQHLLSVREQRVLELLRSAH